MAQCISCLQTPSPETSWSSTRRVARHRRSLTPWGDSCLQKTGPRMAMGPNPCRFQALRRVAGRGRLEPRRPRPKVLRKRLGEAEEALPVSLWHLRKAEEAVALFHSNPGTGLSLETYTENLKRFGPNLLPESVPRSAWSIVAEQFKGLPVLLLAVAAGISVFTGGLADAAVIMSVVGINAVIGYVTESKSEKTIRSLRSLVRPTALVTRDGETRQVGVEEVVPGDLLVLRPGSYVAADARLLAAQNLSVDESALTGESMPVQKMTRELTAADLPLGDRTNMVYMGTLVTGGQGIAVVVATGPFTEIGQIQILVGEARPPATPMETQLDNMGTKLALMSAGVCAGGVRDRPFARVRVPAHAQDLHFPRRCSGPGGIARSGDHDSRPRHPFHAEAPCTGKAAAGDRDARVGTDHLPRQDRNANGQQNDRDSGVRRYGAEACVGGPFLVGHWGDKSLFVRRAAHASPCVRALQRERDHK